MKRIIFIFLMIFIVFIIYFFTQDNKVYFVSIGDYISKDNTYRKDIIKHFDNKLERYINYSRDDYLIKDLINDIDNNKKIKYENKEYNINNLLIKADIIIISIGMNDLLYYDEVNNNMYSYIDEVMIDMDKLLSKVRYYSKEKIYLYNYFNFEEKYLNYLNSRLEEVSENNNVEIINISDIKHNKKLNEKDYQYISKKTLNKIAKKK